MSDRGADAVTIDQAAPGWGCDAARPGLHRTMDQREPSARPQSRRHHAATPTASQPLTRSRADVYARLIEAQELIAQDRFHRGAADVVIEAALDAVDERLAADARREDLYLASLAVYVQELGGSLQLHAVFADGTVALPAG